MYSSPVVNADTPRTPEFIVQGSLLFIDGQCSSKVSLSECQAIANKLGLPHKQSKTKKHILEHIRSHVATSNIATAHNTPQLTNESNESSYLKSTVGSLACEVEKDAVDVGVFNLPPPVGCGGEDCYYNSSYTPVYDHFDGDHSSGYEYPAVSNNIVCVNNVGESQVDPMFDDDGDELYPPDDDTAGPSPEPFSTNDSTTTPSRITAVNPNSPYNDVSDEMNLLDDNNAGHSPDPHSNNEMTTPLRIASFNVIAPSSNTPGASHTSAVDHLTHALLLFLQRENQSLSDSLFELHVPNYMQPKFGNLFEESYRGRDLSEFFMLPSIESTLYQLIPTQLVQPLCTQSSSSRMREHGYISFLHDNFFVDRIYYMLHEKHGDRLYFWATVILQQQDDLSRLMDFRVASMSAVTHGATRIALDGIADKRKCPINILLQVYADRYQRPSIVLEHIGGLNMQQRFGSLYNCRAKSQCRSIAVMPYVILLHDREINEAGSLLKTADLFLPAPEDVKKKNRAVVAGHALCYPVDTLGNYMPYYEYQRAKLENLDGLRIIIEHLLIIFQRVNPLVNIKTLRDDHEQFHFESELRVSYQMERAILQAFIPFDGQVAMYTSDKDWARMCINFLTKLKEVYHQEFHCFNSSGPLHSSSLDDPEREIFIQHKLFIASRMIMRRIVLVGLDNDFNPSSIIFQEPQPSVNVDWPLLFVGRTVNKGETGDHHPFAYYSGMMSRGDRSIMSGPHDPLSTPNCLREDVCFADIDDPHIGTAVTCNLDAISIFDNDIERFGKTFCNTTNHHSLVCASSPLFKLRRYLHRPPSGASRLTIQIYTKKSSSEHSSEFSLRPDVPGGFVKPTVVPLSHFPTLNWGTVNLNSYTFHIGLTMLELEKPESAEGKKSNFKQLGPGKFRNPWNAKMLKCFVTILKLAQDLYDPTQEGIHSSMNTEYNGSWEIITKPPNQNRYNKLDGSGFSSLCCRIRKICLQIEDLQVVVLNKNVIRFAKKMLKRCIFTAVSPGSKTQNWIATYLPHNDVNGESQLGCTQHNTCVSVVSSLIPNVMSGAKFAFDLGYNVASEAYQHSIYVLNEDAKNVVKNNLSLNVQLAKEHKPIIRAHGIVKLSELWEVFVKNGSGLLLPDRCTEFLTCLVVGMDVCVASRGYAHGYITKALPDCSLFVMFYETNVPSFTHHLFLFDDIILSEVPVTEVYNRCVLFNIKERTALHVDAHRMRDDLHSDFPVIYIRYGIGQASEIFDHNSNVLCPIWMSSNLRDSLHVGGLNALADQVGKDEVFSQKQKPVDIPPASTDARCASNNSKPMGTASPDADTYYSSNSPSLSNKGGVLSSSDELYLGPCGIKNPGVLCYMIAITQLLLSFAPLYHAVLGAKYTASAGGAQWGSIFLFKQLISQMVAVCKSRQQNVVDVDDILKNIDFNGIYQGGTQCCAMEAYDNLTHKMFDTLPDLRRMFVYSKCTQYACSKCQESLDVDPANSDTTTVRPITISLSNKPSTTPVSFSQSRPLDQLLHGFFSGEIPSDTAVIVCPNCNEYKDVICRISLCGTPPTIFTIHLDRINNELHKDIVPVPISPVTSFDFEQTQVEYELIGMVCHIGKSIHDGHYIAYGYRQILGVDGILKRQWCCFNDATVSLIVDLKSFLKVDRDYQQTVVMVLYQLRTNAMFESPSTTRESRRRSVAGDGNPSSPKRLRSHMHPPDRPPHGKKGMPGGARKDDSSEDDASSNYSSNSEYDPQDEDGSASTDDEFMVDALEGMYAEDTLFSDVEFPAAAIHAVPHFKHPDIHKWPMYGNKRSCGLGSAHFSLHATDESMPDIVGSLVGIKGPPNGVGSMCVYSSQGKTAESDLKSAKAEAHELPFLLHTILGHAELEDHDLLHFLCHFIESVDKIEQAQESMKDSLKHPSSLRVEYNFMWDPKDGMPCNFIPLLTSEIAKTVPGTLLQDLFSKRLQLHAHPIRMLKGMLKIHLDSLVTEHNLQHSKNWSSKGGVLQKGIVAIREILSETTPDISATYIQHAMMYMGLMGGKHGAYSPTGLKDILQEHPYEIKVSSDASVTPSELARRLGFQYVIQHAELFPDLASSDIDISLATSSLSNSMVIFASKKKTIKDKDFRSLVANTGRGLSMCKVHNMSTYIKSTSTIHKCWTSFFEKWEGASGSVIAPDLSSRSLPFSQRLASLLLHLGTNTHPFLESFGVTLHTIVVVIIDAYYSDLQVFIGVSGMESTHFLDLCKVIDLHGSLQDLVDEVHSRRFDQSLFYSNRAKYRKVLVSKGNDHASDEVSSFHGKPLGVHQYFRPGYNMNILLIEMFGSSFNGKSATVPEWQSRFTSALLFRSFNELLTTAKYSLSNGSGSCYLEPCKLNQVFHKAFIESEYKYIWFHPFQLLLKKKILLIDASTASIPVPNSLVDILLSNNVPVITGKFSFLGSLLTDPISSSLVTQFGNSTCIDDFSSFVGSHGSRVGSCPTDFERFLVSCDRLNLGICNCVNAEMNRCKCNVWDKLIGGGICFSLGELRGGSVRSRNAFLTRARAKLPYPDPSFNPTPNSVELSCIDRRLMEPTSFYQSLSTGITPKVIMAWRGLRIYFLQHPKKGSLVSRFPLDSNHLARSIIQVLQGDSDNGASVTVPSLLNDMIPSFDNLPVTSPLVRCERVTYVANPQHDSQATPLFFPFQSLSPVKTVTEGHASLPPLETPQLVLNFSKLTPGKPH